MTISLVLRRREEKSSGRKMTFSGHKKKASPQAGNSVRPQGGFVLPLEHKDSGHRWSSWTRRQLTEAWR